VALFAAMQGTNPILKVEGLKTWFGSARHPIRAVDGVTFSVSEGETVALVGESGCGKSVTALSLARLVAQPPGFYAGGRILLQGEDVLTMTERRLTSLRGKEISYIFQEPATSLNPVFRVGWQIEEALRLHQSGINPREEMIRLMKMVGLPDPERKAKCYPHEMSGGMQQRVMVAMALACRPKLLIADEPTTALDVTIQAQILELIKDLQKELKMAVLIITHNLGLVADMAHTVHVMYAGRIIESGGTEEVLTKPAHPYTVGLLKAVPKLSSKGTLLQGIEGSVPNPAHLPPGCAFSPRCSRAQACCREQEPDITPDNATGRKVRCFFPYRDNEGGKK
jgi:oligopeptide/dipeptide ABC transporter ATP-binding protein